MQRLLSVTGGAQGCAASDRVKEKEETETETDNNTDVDLWLFRIVSSLAIHQRRSCCMPDEPLFSISTSLLLCARIRYGALPCVRERLHTLARTTPVSFFRAFLPLLCCFTLRGTLLKPSDKATAALTLCSSQCGVFNDCGETDGS